MGNAVLDLVWGLISFAALLAVSFLTRQQQDIRPALLTTCVAFFAAAFYRARPGRRRLWLAALLVALGGVLPVMAMNQLGIAFTDRLYIVALLLMGVGAAGLGAGIRRLTVQRGLRYGAALGCFTIIGALIGVFVAIPR